MNDRNYQLLNDLNQYDKALDDIYHNYAMRHGLSDTALWILYFVVSSGQDCTQTDISEQWSYRRQTVNSALKSLESHGFLSLEPLPDNSKSKRIHLTEKGEELCRRAILPLLEAEVTAFQRFSASERATLLRLMEKRLLLLEDEVKKKT